MGEAHFGIGYLAIARLAPERTIVMASHSPAVLGRCSQILRLELAPHGPDLVEPGCPEPDADGRMAHVG